MTYTNHVKNRLQDGCIVHYEGERPGIDYFVHSHRDGHHVRHTCVFDKHRMDEIGPYALADALDHYVHVLDPSDPTIPNKVAAAALAHTPSTEQDSNGGEPQNDSQTTRLNDY